MSRQITHVPLDEKDAGKEESRAEKRRDDPCRYY
jgi:hypothetical protein